MLLQRVKRVPFTVSPVIADLPHKRSESAGTYRDSCTAQGHGKKPCNSDALCKYAKGTFVLIFKYNTKQALELQR
jgi:hypothetical protein